MLMECLIQREGPTRVTLDKFDYDFKPRPELTYGDTEAAVCHVNSAAHVDRLLHTRLYRKYEPKAAQPKKVLTSVPGPRQQAARNTQQAKKNTEKQQKAETEQSGTTDGQNPQAPQESQEPTETQGAATESQEAQENPQETTETSAPLNADAVISEVAELF